MTEYRVSKRGVPKHCTVTAVVGGDHNALTNVADMCKNFGGDVVLAHFQSDHHLTGLAPNHPRPHDIR